MKHTLVALCLVAAAAGYLLTTVVGKVDNDLQNNYFEQRPTSENWIGADGTYSIDLGFGNVLFGWQDSWLGTVNNNVRYRSGFVRNSVGKSYVSNGKPTAPITFYYNKDGNNPSILHSFDDGHVDWPAGGALINGKLHIVTMTVAGGLDQTHYGFHCISNPYDDPRSWRDQATHWPIAGVAWNRALGRRDGYVYILGGRSGQGPYSEKAVMSRYKEDDIANCKYDNRMCWGYAYGIPAWQWDCSPNNLIPLYDNPSETSLDWNDFLQKWVSWRIVFGSTEIWVGTADAPQGPWKFWKAWDYPDYVKNTKLWGSYHPKAHVTLSKTSSDMLVTFATNIADEDWDILANNPWVYCPFPVRMQFNTSLNFQIGMKAGTYSLIAKTSQLALAITDSGSLSQFYPLPNNIWKVVDAGNGQFSISINNKFIAINNNKLVTSSQAYPWKIIPTMDENNFYVVGANGTLALDNGCHLNENAAMGVVVFWNVQYPCQKWTFR